MTSVITGDIINSRDLQNPDKWIIPLKDLLDREGSSPQIWELYRGDSFQLEVINAEEALLMAIRIKATLKSIKHMDVRMAIGIGNKKYDASKITESNGEAFIYSGDQFEKLKKEKLTLAVKTPWEDFDKEMNVSIKLALIAMDHWKPKTAEIVKVSLEYPQKGQIELAEILGINQSSVSEGQKRSHFSEIMELESLYREKIKKLDIK
ncbi:MAG TPA: hypothetical protein VFG10_11655 [Saprospiraceae bacterium]|nr:hypothetical protein [Saprospiraceae bacterium]